MTEETDPPCYKAARKKEQEILDRLGEMSAIDKEISQLEKKIEHELEERRSTMKGPYARLSKESWSSQGDSPDSIIRSSSSSSCSSSSDVEEGKCKEVEDMQKFLQAETLGMIGDCLEKSPDKVPSPVSLDSLLMPPPYSPAARNGSPAVSDGHGKVTPCSPGLGLKETVEEYMRPAETKESSDGESLEYGSGDELDIT